jgi:hypothetical protein
MRLRALLVLALLGAADPAHALSAVLHFDGTVAFASPSSAPSLVALGISRGSPVHYEVKVDTAANGFIRYPGGPVTWFEDYWGAPNDHADHFYAELIAQAYPTPGSYYGGGAVGFRGVDLTDQAFSCAPLGRLFVGVQLFYIDGCGSVADWQVGHETAASHNWHDPDTGQFVSVTSFMTLTDIVPVPEPGATAMLASGATLLACLRRRRRRS